MKLAVYFFGIQLLIGSILIQRILPFLNEDEIFYYYYRNIAFGTLFMILGSFLLALYYLRSKQ